MFQAPTTRAEASELDRRDPLAGQRAQFDLPDGVIYLVGHSLGPPTKAARARLDTAQVDWATGLVRSWNAAGWIDLAERTGDRIAALIGASPGEVIVCDSVSVNLFKLAAAALPLAGGARRIAIEGDEFPTDQYIAEALASLTNAAFLRLPPEAGLAALSGGGVLIRSAVNYRSGEVAPIADWEAAARSTGAIIIWDLSHATGVLALDLGASGARLAAGCTYKYLNGGPGAPAFVYAAASIADTLQSPLPGWMGHAAPFAFQSTYAPRAGAARFASGTPGILSLAALSGALEAFDGVALRDVQAKAAALGTLCIARADALGLAVTSPRDDTQRGGHVSLRVENGYPIVQALAARGILADFRQPDTIRFGFSPLFVRFADVWDAMDALGDIIADRSWDVPAYRSVAKVT